MRISYHSLGEGEKAIDNTMEIMKHIVNTASRDFIVINNAKNIISALPTDRATEAQAIYLYVQSKCRFTRDPHRTEMLQSPQYLLYEIQNKGIALGDCDDLTMLGCALMKAVGLPVGFRAISANGDKLHHVYGLVNIGASRWTPFDATEKNFSFGYEPPYARRKDVFVL